MTPSALALVPADLVLAARRLDVELAALEAVVDVESRGSGFLPDGRPVILFEGHRFWDELTKRGVDPDPIAAQGHGDVLYPSWTKQHYVGGAGEYQRLAEAEGIALTVCRGRASAALCSASWGMFQIMGFNHRACGFASVEDFVDAMKRHERDHLAAFCAFVREEGILPYLQEKDWRGFARRYNGTGQVDVYAGRLAAAHAKRSA